MSLQDTVVNSGDQAIESALDRGESDRQSRWAADREDRQSLRASLEGPISDYSDAPKKKSLDEPPSDPMKPFEGIRATAERMYDEAFVDADRAEKQRQDFEQFQNLATQVQRQHGIDGVSGIRALVAAEAELRRDPTSIHKLIADYYQSNNYATAVEQRDQQETLAQVHKFFNEYDIPDQVSDLMASYMRSPEFQNSRSGDHVKDMKAAYGAVRRGLDRLHAR